MMELVIFCVNTSAYYFVGNTTNTLMLRGTILTRFVHNIRFQGRTLTDVTIVLGVAYEIEVVHNISTNAHIVIHLYTIYSFTRAFVTGENIISYQIDRKFHVII